MRAASIIAVTVLSTAGPLSGQHAGETDGPLPLPALGPMVARSVGPSGQGGRVTAVDVLPSNPDVIWVGGAAGGVWRSENGGVTWEPVFDDQPVLSIGAIAVNPSNPDLVWVGTGEGNPRNSVNHGNGVYRTRDGGHTWEHLGLEASRSIHRIVLHPRDPDVVWLAVLGSPFGDSGERGVYRTVDGGETWERVLYVDERTGAADLVQDPENPLKLVAAMWSHRRTPWDFTSGGEGSGLWVTHDGGEGWTERTAEDGLPPGELGRIGLAVAPSDRDRVYALVEAETSVLLRSDDGGRSFETVNSEPGVSPRPFYYADVFVDPANENRLYRLGGQVDVSEDGGESFETLVSGALVHVDHHAWWVHPDDPSLILDGNDGGAAVSRDRGRTWQVYHNLPLGQFYHVNVDDERPYNIYGGAQDNDSFRGPAYTWAFQGIQNHQWENLGCCADGFDMAPDPGEGRYGYSLYQRGTLLRYDRETGHRRVITPTHPDEADLRFNWNAAFATDPLRPERIYLGSQFVHASDDDGTTWRVLSPDLTTNDSTRQRQSESGGLTIDDSGAESYTTVTTIAASPVQEGVIWAGTDDGHVQVTRDDGASWTNTVDGMAGVPVGAWVPQIHASHHAEGEAWVVLEDHRRDDWTPYVYHTADFGDSWRRVAADVDGYALSVLQDPVESGLVWVGTDRGLWVSVDGGGTFQRWDRGVPAAPARDLAVQPREHDLVVGTFGRSFFVLDDVRPLRAVAREGVGVLTDGAAAPNDAGPDTGRGEAGRAVSGGLRAWPVPDAVQAVVRWQPGTVFPGDFLYRGENRPFGARIRYSLPWREKADGEGAGDETDGGAGGGGGPSDEGSRAGERGDEDGGEPEVIVEILDGDRVLRTLRGDADPGMNRVVWGLDRAGVRSPRSPEPAEDDGPEPGGPDVLPGRYTVRISHGPDTVSTPVTVLPDPREDFDRAVAVDVGRMWDRLLAAQARATELADRLREVPEAVRRVDARLDDHPDESRADSLRTLGRRAKAAADSLLHHIVPERIQGFSNDPTLVSSRLGTAARHLSTGRWHPPTEGARRSLERAVEAVDELAPEVEAFFEEAWARYRAAVREAEVELVR